MRSFLLRLFVCIVTWGLTVRGQKVVDQATLDQLADTLKVTWTVVSNTREVERFDATLTLENTGTETLEYGDWELYLYSLYPLEPDHLKSPGQSVELEDKGLNLTCVSGMLFTLRPTAQFRPLYPGGSRVLRFHVKYWSVARSDVFPNWYLTGTAGTEPRIITSTAGTDPAFVTQSKHPQQQKRYDFDTYSDGSPQERYRRNFVPYAAPDSEVRVVPRPWKMTVTEGSGVTLSSAWKVWDASAGQILSNEVSFVEDKLANYGVSKAAGGVAPTSNVIILNTANIVFADDDMDTGDDAYSLEVDGVNNVINLTGQGPSGVFWGLQTLLSLLQDNGTLSNVTIFDSPRFRFRGLSLDIARNFRSREEIERLLGVMAMYKLNRLHLHLTDDEGWRIEIDGLPELTQLGSKRCHDPEENQCLLPQLGSGPFSNNSGSGYLTASDYRAILTLASTLHIQVIPEVDLPGHARAAIRAMEKRYRTYMAQNNPVEAKRYRLVDVNDTSEYLSPQFFNDNVINVCMNSSYAFVAKVVEEIKKLHTGVQELKEYHSGLDEVAGAWVNSTLCQQLMDADSFANQSLKQYFFKRVSDITSAQGVNLGGWEDGLMLTGNQPFNRSLAPNSKVYANVWNNVWEWGSSPRTYNLANMGYQVVMSQGTSLYFDHPYEPHWEERGFYWATRFTDTQKTFGFMPMSYYDNIAETRSGRPLTREDICGENDVNCPPLEKPQNIAGMQGQLWSETVRTSDQADSLLFPRVLALAERAWHFAPWEKENNATIRRQLMTEDWYSFARAVGYRELPRLDKLGIKYRIPPPGAVVERQRLRVSGGYPGLVVEHSEDCGHSWTPADGTERLKETDRLWLRTRSADGQRYSRAVELTARPELPPTPQSVLDYMRDYLVVQFQITDNYEQYGISKYVATILLNNTGDKNIPAGNWEIQFPSVQWLEIDPVREGREFILQDQKMALSHVQGYLFRLSPLFDFPPFEKGTSMKIVIRGQFWSVSKFEQFPNYFVAAEGANARVINNTVGESLSFVMNFSKVNQWKRDSTDKFDPLTPSARFGKQADVNDVGTAPLPYLPTPLTFEMDRSKTVSFKQGWVIVAPQQWTGLAQFLKDQFSDTDLVIQSNAITSRYIELRQESEGVPESAWPGAYSITISPQQQSIVIIARNTTGALYGIQSLINMALQSEDGTTVFQISATDAPRFSFRGMFLDVARNFHSKDSVIKLLQVMGMFKLNHLHLHLADDEGWRLEIPGLPELTTVGSTRCHDPTEERCLTPVLGSGPDPDNAGSGYYTVQDYKDILQYAARREIQIIPEFDMPGHARAAIKAMALRRRLKLEAGDAQAAHEFELDEVGDPSTYSSVQMFDDNAVNPCLESTYRFIRYVMLELKTMHEGVNPLRTYHFGGDEVAEGAWVDSKACSSYEKEHTDLKFLFSTRVAAIAAELGLNLGCWEDGVIDHGKPIPRKDMAPSQVFANAWQNVWEWGLASRAYILANAGYKVIMGPATHSYFDFPSEPDPDERGFYWASRYIDTRKVFFFQPEDLWSNVHMTVMGSPYTLQDVCGADNKGCPELTHKDNVVGMQGHLWSETVRTDEQIYYMIFPRLLALADRAWHAAPWEGQGKEAEWQQQRDWVRFTNSLGHGQLLVLDRLGVTYRICPPGVRQEGGNLKVNTEFPGMKTQYMTANSQDWHDVIKNQISVSEGQRVHVRTLSADGHRFSKAVQVVGAKNEVASGSKDPLSSSYLCVLLAAVHCLLRVMFKRV